MWFIEKVLQYVSRRTLLFFTHKSGLTQLRQLRRFTNRSSSLLNLHQFIFHALQIVIFLLLFAALLVDITVLVDVRVLFAITRHSRLALQLGHLRLLVLLQRLLLNQRPVLGRRHVVRIRVDDRSAEAALEYLDQIQRESRSDLIQVGRFLVQNLIVPKPDSVVQIREVENVIDEWLAFRVVVWNAEDLRMGRRGESD